MTVNLLTIRDIGPYLKRELGDQYNDNEIASLSRIIIKTLFSGHGLHRIYDTGYQLNAEDSSKILSITEELKTGKPYQYILGETEFYGCRIKVSPAVLIPRPETEELVDIVIKENRNFGGDIIDFGTGSGCIAIALALNIPGANVTGIDISDEALTMAGLNARLNNAMVSFERNNMLDFHFSSGKKAGIIVSNPPYVRISEKARMRRNVLEFEPPQALFVEDSDPLLYYRTILGLSKILLVRGGKIYFEINEALGEQMEKLLASYGYSEIRIMKDLNNRNRFATGIKDE